MGRQQSPSNENHLKSPNSQLAARPRSRHPAQTKTAPEEAAIDYLLYSYDLFLLAIPIKPIRPEPNSQTAGGTGTVAPPKSNGAGVMLP
mgnify:CR=1 FL=1